MLFLCSSLKLSFEAYRKQAMNKVSQSYSNVFYHWRTSPWPMLLWSTPNAGADIERGRLYIISSALLPGPLLRRPPESPTAVRRHQTTSIIYDRDRDAACGLFLCLSCALVRSLYNKWIVNAFPPAVFPSVPFSLFPRAPCFAVSHKSTGKLWDQKMTLGYLFFTEFLTLCNWSNYGSR